MSPVALSTTSAGCSPLAITFSPTSSARAAVPSAAVTRPASASPVAASPAPATSTALTRPGCSRSRCRRDSGTNSARTGACVGASENSPSRSTPSTRRTISRSARLVSSRRPWSTPDGMADGTCTRTTSASPALAPSSSASTGLMNASLPAGPLTPGTAVEPPEAIVNAEYAHRPGAPPARRVGHDRVEGDERHRRPDRPARTAQVVSERLPHERRAGEEDVGGPEAVEGEPAKARPHGVAHEQRACEHRYCDGGADHDGEVGAPEPGQVAQDERADAHPARSTRCPSDRSKRRGIRAASSALCVTTTRIVSRARCKSNRIAATASADR